MYIFQSKTKMASVTLGTIIVMTVLFYKVPKGKVSLFCVKVMILTTILCLAVP